MFASDYTKGKKVSSANFTLRSQKIIFIENRRSLLSNENGFHVEDLPGKEVIFIPYFFHFCYVCKDILQDIVENCDTNFKINYAQYNIVLDNIKCDLSKRV